MNREGLRPEAAVQDVLRSLPEPPVSVDFRARLRREFADGSIRVQRARSRSLGSPARAAAVAAAMLAALVMVANRGPQWTVEGVTGSGAVVVNGHPIPAHETETLRRAIRPGAHLATSGDVQVDLVLAGRMAIQIAPGSQASIPNSPGRWFGRLVHNEVSAGEVRFTTGAALRGSGVRIRTPEVVIDVQGTTFAVIRESAGSCVCVLEGRLRMSEAASGVGEVVREGTRRYVFNDGRPPLVEPILPMETMKLTMLRDRFSARSAGAP
jgi:ferric-dicitrate binding protein FerR (iron transport regulator)